MVSFRPCPIPLVVARAGAGFGAAAASPTAETTSSRPSRDRALTRVCSGVYASTRDWEALDPWDRYLARVHAVRLRRPDAVFCLESAAALQGLPVFDEPKHVHVLSAWPAAHSTTSGGLALHSFADARAVTDTEYGSAVGVADTVLDLVRLLPPAFALAVADAALREAAAEVTIEALIARARAQSWTRGIRQLEWVLLEADARAESVAESVARAVILWLGYARPELQVEFHYEGVTDRVDFYWRAQRVIGESDGYGKYRTGDIRKSEGRLILEKKREDRLRRHGHPFPRWDFSDSMHVTPLDAKLRAAGLQPIRPQDARMLATLQRNPRSFPWTQR